MENSTFTTSERVKYAFETIDRDQLVDDLAELEAWRSAAASNHIDSPSDLEVYIESSISGDAREDLESNLEQHKEFFETVVSAMEGEHGTWPCAEPWDGNLQNAVTDHITQGAEAIRLIESFLVGDADRDDLVAFFKEVTG